MQFRSLAPSNSGSTTTDSFLTAIIVATVFARATIATPASGPARDSLPNVRRNISDSPGDLPLDEFFRPAINAVQTIPYVPPDSCLFYSYGIHEEAKTQAKEHNLLTVWDMYPDHTFPQLQNYTDREREVFYRFLSSRFARRCSGIGRSMAPPVLCSDAILILNEFGDYADNMTGISEWDRIFNSEDGQGLTLPGGKVVALPDWKNPVALERYCSNPRRFSGTDPHSYWGN